MDAQEYSYIAILLAFASIAFSILSARKAYRKGYAEGMSFGHYDGFRSGFRASERAERMGLSHVPYDR